MSTHNRHSKYCATRLESWSLNWDDDPGYGSSLPGSDPATAHNKWRHDPMVMPNCCRADDNDEDEDVEQKEKEKKPDTSLFNSVQQNLFKDRTILVFGEINQKVSQSIVAQLLALSVENDKPIRMIINSPGGHVESADSIHDIIRFIKPKVVAIGSGWVASAGCHIFLAANKSDRLTLPNTRFLIHQPLGGAGGRAMDIAIEAREIIKMRERLNAVISKETGQPLERVARDTDKNYWMSAEEAKSYGIVDRIVNSHEEIS